MKGPGDPPRNAGTHSIAIVEMANEPQGDNENIDLALRITMAKLGLQDLK